MPYSVSPRLTFATIGGKNSMKRSTRMPTAFAAVKCPASWRMMSAAKPAKARTQLTRASVARSASGPRQAPRQAVGTRASGPDGDELGRHVAGGAIAVVERLEAADRLGGAAAPRGLGGRRGGPGGQPPAGEGGHR